MTTTTPTSAELRQQADRLIARAVALETAAYVARGEALLDEMGLPTENEASIVHPEAAAAAADDVLTSRNRGRLAAMRGDSRPNSDGSPLSVAWLEGFDAQKNAEQLDAFSRLRHMPHEAECWCIKSPANDAHRPMTHALNVDPRSPEYYTVTRLDHSEGSEVRVVDPTTGGEKGSKLARFDLIPIGALTALAEHYGRGALKYEDRNWERGYRWSLSYAALQRHLTAWWAGEDIDTETGSSHLDAVAWHAFTLRTFVDTHPAGDDRPTS